MVEWKKLGEVVELARGVRVVKTDLATEGMIPVFQNSLSPLGYYDIHNYPAGTTFVISAGAAGDIGFSDMPFWAADDCLGVTCPNDTLNKFVFYFLQTKQSILKSQVRKASVPRLSRTVVEKLDFPCIPISEQSRIVGILDTFTVSIANLKEQIGERRKQYEHYRDQLLDLEEKEGVEMKTLGDLGEFYGGLSGKTKDDFQDGNAKFITYMNIYSNPSLNLKCDDKVRIEAGEKQNTIQYGDVLFTGSSETPEECGMTSVVTEVVDEPIYLNSFCFGFRLNKLDLFDPNFLKHYLRCNLMRTAIATTASGVTRFNVSKKRLGRIQISIPSLSEQSRIVSILDQFEASIANLEAQLQEREKQYEHYRNQLLTF